MAGRPTTREEFLGSMLGALAPYWLEVSCPCGVLVRYPCKLLAREKGNALRVGDVLPRLRCRSCRARPARVAATDDPTGGLPGCPAPWRLELWP